MTIGYEYDVVVSNRIVKFIDVFKFGADTEVGTTWTTVWSGNEGLYDYHEAFLNFPNLNPDITYLGNPGKGGPAISIEYLDPIVDQPTTTVAVTSRKISVTLSKSTVITATALEVFIAIRNTAEAVALVTARMTVGNEGNIQVPTTESNLIVHTVSIASTNINDTFLGLGAWSVRITGLDHYGNEMVDTMQLAGQVPQPLNKEFWRIFRIEVTESYDSANPNLGNIWIGDGIFTAGVPADKHGHIRIGGGKSLMALMTVPKGYTGFIKSLNISVDQGKSAEVELRVRQPKGSFNIEAQSPMYENVILFGIGVKLPVPELSDIEMRGKTDVGTVSMSAIFEMTLKPNSISEEVG